ncbi:MAG: dienelactone hydrolase family protein [Bacteroidota bacterium]|nr:dienelactone hydrolase family protein [Bacteroidota bacterium]
MPLHFLSSAPQQQVSENPTLIMLHGRGSDEHDLFGLKEHFDPRLTIYSLRAPNQFEWGGYTWFDLHEDGSVDEESFFNSTSKIITFINTLQTKKLFLLGFSMGAIMSYSIALTHPNICKGISALSGFAPLQIENKYRLQELQDLHIFISHGIQDPIIPVSSARKTKELLARSNALVSYNEYDMAHQINDVCLHDVNVWMQNLI